MAREKYKTLSEQMYYVLLAVLEEVCGVDIMNRVMELSNGRIKIGPGTLYAMLDGFEQIGFIRLTRQEGRQKWYVATDEGKTRLRDEIYRLETQLADGIKIVEVNN